MANRLSSAHFWVEWALQLCNWWAWVGWETRSGWTGLLDLLNVGLFLSWYITDFQIHMFRSWLCFSILADWKKCSDVQSPKSLHASLVWLNWSNPSDLCLCCHHRVCWELWRGRYLSNMFKPQHQTAKEWPWMGWIPNRAHYHISQTMGMIRLLPSPNIVCLDSWCSVPRNEDAEPNVGHLGRETKWRSGFLLQWTAMWFL